MTESELVEDVRREARAEGTQEQRAKRVAELIRTQRDRAPAAGDTRPALPARACWCLLSTQVPQRLRDAQPANPSGPIPGSARADRDRTPPGDERDQREARPTSPLLQECPRSQPRRRQPTAPHAPRTQIGGSRPSPAPHTEPLPRDQPLSAHTLPCPP